MKRFGLVVLVLFAVCVFIPVNNAVASSVQDQLKTTIDNVMQILSDPSLTGEESTAKRRASLRKVIHERFSFAKMSQLSLARHWNQRSDEEKKAFIELFGQLLEDTYVAKIEAYTSEKVIYVKEFVKKNKAQVSTKVVSDTVEIPIDYRMYQAKDGSWMVYDMVIEGVSLVGNYRSQFDQILRKNSYEKLVEELKEKMGS
ncbi:MlaC/ttg2D family ABC transporter substrate-binding protein [Desulfobacula toluolica]|uniref:Ttg2: toluene tolerance protein n=1 Tax=Desulfobacula toluolica (strain DSM 7467 / Tol2) TaxID=651182 RepID=K0NG16_DESTT|nr:ABC transporter substrate-binding protein [Desulfobacula toluolica]CCK79885.1 Ttg2: toluene tolerance protein [Desulfobacula toluolica Tol2]